MVMKFNDLWKILFKKKSETEDLALHVAGAMVRHRNPFESLEVPRNDKELDQGLIDQFVKPFYMPSMGIENDDQIMEFARVSKEINIDIVRTLLGDFNWRCRIVGAYFAAINKYQELENIIGNHLLKSEVCYAGAGYCLALTEFDSDNSKNYLKNYLEYYLEQKDLWFDQSEAFCALQILDRSASDQLIDKWKEFTSNKPDWNLEKSSQYFAKRLENISKIREAAKTL